MRKYHTVEKKVSEMCGLTCDVCNRDIHAVGSGQNYLIDIGGGYGSHGDLRDGDEFECDFCEECIMKIMKQHVVNNPYRGNRHDDYDGPPLWIKEKFPKE